VITATLPSSRAMVPPFRSVFRRWDADGILPR
jgi:hypothetical protein